ncbi:uncharacterized protein N7487_003078 [Penicillium crustosum]|uniref:uncharacterized protein n=1 Tax=Penicillium crustosum TaxID=36656 RepID=UPI0023949561|nr:uncharacterized protein N7487_003078 [Penicillium crustosum]KAJ5419528.1 hypothetical protein N7487_003078 [Penicillium crustosum]
MPTSYTQSERVDAITGDVNTRVLDCFARDQLRFEVLKAKLRWIAYRMTRRLGMTQSEYWLSVSTMGSQHEHVGQ